jgi:hypothetical protein
MGFFHFRPLTIITAHVFPGEGLKTMSAVLMNMRDFKDGEKAVLVRNGITIKGVLTCIETPLGEEPFWLIRPSPNSTITLHPSDTVYLSSSSPCFNCTTPIKKTLSCTVCFDGFL